MPLAAVGALAAALVAVTALAGCVPAPPPEPQPLSDAEIQSVRVEQDDLWWQTIAPGTRPPVIGVIEAVPPEQYVVRQGECISAAGLPGVTVTSDGALGFNGAAPNDPAFIAFRKQQWICAHQYPSQLDDAAFLSPEQLEFVYDYYASRYQPCLRTMGIELLGFPTKADFLRDSETSPSWVPYEQTVRPIPTTEQWQVLAQRCPLPAVLDPYALPGSAALDGQNWTSTP